MFDFEKPHLYPKHQVGAHLVYAAQSSDVDTVFINGQKLVEKGKLLNADQKNLFKNVDRVLKEILA